MSARGWRALAFVGLAVLAVVVVGVAHLGRWPPVRTAAPRPTSVAAAGAWQLGLASFGDRDHGAVTMGGGSPITGASYVTADGGRTWRTRHVGLSATTFLDRDHAITVALAPTLQLEASADAGRTWTGRMVPVVNRGAGFLVNRVVGGPAFLDPDNGWWLDVPGPQGTAPAELWRTGDGGRTWRPLPAPPGLTDGTRISDLVFLDQSAGALVAVPGHGAQPLVLTTRDGGGTWRPSPVPDAPVAGPGVELATGGAQLLVERGRLLLSVDLTVPGGGEFIHWSSVSQDRGQTWAPWVKEPASTAFSYAAALVDGAGRLLIANDRSLWMSVDDGRTWEQRRLDLPIDQHALAVVFAGEGSLLVATAGPNPGAAPGVRLLSSDEGGRWTELGLPRRPVS